jgi:hypothetical protein
MRIGVAVQTAMHLDGSRFSRWAMMMEIGMGSIL